MKKIISLAIAFSVFNLYAYKFEGYLNYKNISKSFIIEKDLERSYDSANIFTLEGMISEDLKAKIEMIEFFDDVDLKRYIINVHIFKKEQNTDKFTSEKSLSLQSDGQIPNQIKLMDTINENIVNQFVFSAYKKQD